MDRRRLSLFACALAAAPLLGAEERPAPAEFPSTIASVTVYADRARVTRKVPNTRPGPDGRILAAVAGLPDALIDGTVQVRFPTAPGVRVLKVEVDRQYRDRFTSDEAAKRRQVLLDLDEEGKTLAAREAALTREADLLKGLSIGAQPDAGDQPKPKPLAPDAWQKVLDAVAQSLARNAEGRVAAAKTRRDWARRRAVAAEALQEMSAYHQTASKRVLVEADFGPGVAGQIAHEMELSYLVPGASWTPSYDVRVLPDQGQIQVSRFALIAQRTGEDWKDASLICSTAVPAVSATLPGLLAWRIEEAKRPPATPEASTRERREILKSKLNDRKRESRDAESQNDNLRDEAALAIQESYEAESEGRTKGSGRVLRAAAGGGAREGWSRCAECTWPPVHELAGGYDYAFPAIRPETLATDGKPVRVCLGTDRFPGRLAYEAAPLASPLAFLKADLKNTTQAPFLAGEAHIFLGGDFLGTAPFKTVAVGETVPVPLGADEKIKIARKARDLKGSAGLFGTRARTETEVEITVTSFLKEPVELRLIDRAPYSVQDGLEVELGEVAPKPSEEVRKHMLAWGLTLAPGKPQTVRFRYSVATPEHFDLFENADMEGAR